MQVDRIMNAAEIIREIETLPPEERGKVIDFVYHLPNEETIAAINEPVEKLQRFDSVEDLFKDLDS